MPEHFRTWRLVKLGLALHDIDESPAVALDWLLAIESTYQRVSAERESKGA